MPYRALLTPPAIEIQWREQQPFIAPHTIARWELAMNFFDADVLLTFDLVDKGLAGKDLPVGLPGLHSWRTLPWVSDHELRQMTSRGLSDLHVHVGGVRIAQALWRDLMERCNDPTVDRVLVKAYQNDPFPMSDRSPLQDRIDKAIDQWSKLVRCVIGADVRVSPSRQLTTWSTWSSDRLAFERLILIRAWSRLLHAAAIETAEPDLENALHGYLGAKHQFFRMTRQAIFDGVPGLRHFDEQYFRRTRRSGRRGWTGALGSRWGSSPRRDFAPVADACMYMLESPHLQRLELRFAPSWKTAADVVRFFHFWDTVDQEIAVYLTKLGREPVDIRFAIHFSRTHRSHAWQTSRETATGLVMNELDRSSALLRLALSQPDPACGAVRRWPRRPMTRPVPCRPRPSPERCSGRVRPCRSAAHWLRKPCRAYTARVPS
jgi:hypothetical protein